MSKRIAKYDTLNNRVAVETVIPDFCNDSCTAIKSGIGEYYVFRNIITRDYFAFFIRKSPESKISVCECFWNKSVCLSSEGYRKYGKYEWN